MNISDETLKTLFSETHTIAALGVNNRPGEPNYETLSYEQSQGYKIIPVNPNVHMILGQPTKSSLQDISEKIDLIHVFPHHPPMAQIEQFALNQGCKAIWIEPGAEDHTLHHENTKTVPIVHGIPFQPAHRRLMSGLQM